MSPMKSKAQRRFLHATDPELAEEFERKTPKGAALPEHARPSSKQADKKPTKKGRSK